MRTAGDDQPMNAGPRAFGPSALLAAAALALLVLSSCAGPLATVRGRYNSELNRWTRSARIYRGVDVSLSVVATYRSPSFRRAYAEYYAESFDLSASEKARLMEEESTRGGSFTEFFLSVHAAEEALNDLDAPDSSWKVYLEDDRGRRTAPAFIRRLRGRDPVRAEFFPYLDLWSTAYEIGFPLRGAGPSAGLPAPDSGHLRLVLASVLGRVELSWPIEPPGRARGGGGG